VAMAKKNVSAPSYGEPVHENQLRKGEVYFMVTYLDEARLVPQVKTLAFLGENVGGKAKGSLWFQDAESFFELGAYPHNKTGDTEIYRCQPTGLSNIYELDKAIKGLTRCLERRSKK
jgi:hypothetical protein